MKQKPKLIRLNISDQTEKNRSDEPTPEEGSLTARAKYLEKHNKLGEAVKLYKKLIRSKRFNENYYDRLMLIYRKQKKYQQELRVINAGIKAFKDLYMPSASGRHHTIISLSKKLNVLIGLTDKKGNSLADREPIAKWKKRKAIVLKKIEAMK